MLKKLSTNYQPQKSLCIVDKEAQDSYDHTRVLALQEEIKTLPWGEVWDEYLNQQGMVSDSQMFEEVREYEKEVLSKR